MDIILCTYKFLGNVVTVMSPEGKPIQINASALNVTGAQNAAGSMMDIYNLEIILNVLQKNCQ